GERATVEIDAEVTAAGRLLATARVTASSHDFDQANNHSAALTRASAAAPTGADLRASLTGQPNRVRVDQHVHYLAVVSNLGPAAATGVVLREQLPTHTEFVSASATQGGCSRNGGSVKCTLGTIPAGGHASVTVIARALAAGSLTALADASGSEAD